MGKEQRDGMHLTFIIGCRNLDAEETAIQHVEDSGWNHLAVTFQQ